jgi:PAS domain S-box-containing protein
MKHLLPDDLPNPVIFYDSKWKITRANSAAISLLGYSNADELAGKSFTDILHKSSFHDGNAICRNTENRKTKLLSSEIRHLRKDGKWISIFSQFGILEKKQQADKSNYIQSGFYTGEEMPSDQLHKHLHCLKILAENIPGLIMLLIDDNHEIKCSVGSEVKKRAKINVGFGAKMLEDRLAKGIITILQPLIDIALEGTSVSREFKHENDFYSVRLTPIAGQTDDKLCVIILQNITETKIVENKLKISKEVAEAANEAKSIFIAKMSHEIRTPLNAIIGFSEQLTKTKLSKKQSSYLEVVNTSSRHLLSTIDDILVISRIESGQTEADEEPFVFENVIKAISDLFDLRVREKNLDFQIKCNIPLNEVLIGDPAKIRQVLINLVGNAIKFTHKGGVVLSCVIVNRNDNKLTIRFEVSDTGIGMTADEVKHIFEPFQQADNSLYRRYFGTGLGLTISKDLVDVMGGEITVKSKPNQGSTFSFVLTFKKSSTKIPAQSQNKSALPQVLPSKMRILFIDDDPNSRMLGKVILSQYKARCTFAGSGDEALEIFKPGDFDIVLLDINMPGKSGIDVARFIRNKEIAHTRHPQTKIIAMTANVFVRSIKEYLKAGMDDFILKPFREAELIEKIIAYSDVKEYQSLQTEAGDNARIENADNHLGELLRITKGDKDYTLLMLDTFIEHAQKKLDQIRVAYSKEDYRTIAEAAHLLQPSFEQLGLKKAAGLLKRIDARYLKKSKFRKDPELIDATLKEMESSIKKITLARGQFS